MSEDDRNQVHIDDEQKRKIKNYFSRGEDRQLISLVEEYGPKWDTISKFMDKSSRQCRDRYVNYLNPNLNVGPWRVEEEELLISKVAEHGQKWSFLTQFFFNRSQVNIKNHYCTLMNRKKKVQKRHKQQQMKQQIEQLKFQQNVNFNLTPNQYFNQFMNQSQNQFQNQYQNQNQNQYQNQNQNQYQNQNQNLYQYQYQNQNQTITNEKEEKEDLLSNFDLSSNDDIFGMNFDEVFNEFDENFF